MGVKNKIIIFILWFILLLLSITPNLTNASTEIVNETKILKTDFNNYNTQKINLSFWVIPDKKTVEKNLKIYPEVKYLKNWKDNKNLELVLQEIINKDTEFLVNTLDKENSKEFVTRKVNILWTPSINFISPNWKITDVNQSIIVKFSKPIIELTNIDNQDKCPIIINPIIEWDCNWITTSSFSFKPKNGFAYWAEYNIEIPSWIKSFDGTITLNWEKFKVTTPEFNLINKTLPNNIEDQLVLWFNDKVNLTDFINNFSLEWFNNADLNIQYFKLNWDILNNTITIFPKTNNWWYSNSYKYKIEKKLSSTLWNVWLKNDIIWDFKINDFLIDYKIVKIIDEKENDIYNENNFLYSNSNKIIYKNQPYVLLNFHKEVPLDKNMFSLNHDFDIFYPTYFEYNNWKETIWINKKSILIKIKFNNISWLNLKILLSKITKSHDINIDFWITTNFKIEWFKNLDYNNSCLYTSGKILLNTQNYKNLKFSGYWDINSIYLVNEFDDYSKCKYNKNYNTYQISTNLNPNTNYNLQILNTFLDENLYNLDKNYTFEFSTNKPENQDKTLDFIWYEREVFYPKYLENKNFSIITKNINKIFVEICYWNLDIEKSDLIWNKKCINKILDVNNLWFKPNISVFWINEIIWNKSNNQIYKVSISKIKEDKTKYELQNYINYNVKTFLIGDSFAILSWKKSNLLTINNFLNNNKSTIESIWLYKNENDYSALWEFLWTKNVFIKNLKFELLKDWNYKILENFDWPILIKLKNWDKIYLKNLNNLSYSTNIKNYISTSKPIYKPWEKVEISWINYTNWIDWLKLYFWKLKLEVRDSNQKVIFSKDVDVNKKWVFETNFVLDENSSLGDYTISADNNYLNFKVENYIKPDFELNLNINKSKIIFPNKAIVEISWKYFAWLEFSNAKISYNLTSRNNKFKPIWYDQYLFWEDNFFNNFKGYYLNDTFKTEKTWIAFLNSKWFLNLVLDLNYDNNKTYDLEVSMFDPVTNKQISKTINFEWFQTSKLIWVKTDKYFYNVWDNSKIDLVWIDLENNLLKNLDFKINIYKIGYKKIFWWNHTKTEEIILFTKNLKTWNDWKTKVNYLFDKSWEYKIEILWNNWYKSIKNIYVWSWDILNPIFRENNLILSLDKEKYSVGDFAKLNISTPKNNLEALVVISKLWEILDYKFIKLNNYSTDYTFEIKQNYLPWFDIWVFWYNKVQNLDKYNDYKKIKSEIFSLQQKLLKENKKEFNQFLYRDLIDQSDYDDKDLLKLFNLKRQELELFNQIIPSYYTGYISWLLDFKTINLDSEVFLDKQNYNPWNKQKITIDVKDHRWNKINWNLNISIIDKSLLDLYDNKEDIFLKIYQKDYSNNNFSSNIYELVKSIDFNSSFFEVSSTNQDFSNIYWSEKWVLSQSAMITNSLFSKNEVFEDAVMESSPNQDVNNSTLDNVYIRNNFKDLVYYNANIEVKNWKAIIDISKLPDNLTTWSIVWFTHTNDLKLWTFTKDFKVNTQVWILPILPKTLTVWDEINLWFNILNNTNSDLKTNFELITSNLEIKTTIKTITLNKNSSTLVEFKAKVLEMPEWWNLDNYYSNIKLLLKSWEITDWFEDKIKINYPSTKEYVYTLGETNKTSLEEKLDFSKVKNYWNVNVNISAWATILTNLEEKLKEVIKFPYYDLSSKLTTLEQIDLLKEIYKNIWKINSYNEIKVYDEYNKKSYTLDELRAEIIKEIPKYLTDKNLFSYFKDCDYSRFEYCGSFFLTKKYLLLNKQIPWIDNKKVYDGYILELQKSLKNTNFTNINDFLVPSIFKDKNFINNNFKPDLKNISNNEKLDYINIFKNIWVNNENTTKFYNELKNSVLIEAKTTFLPTNSYFDNWVWINSWFLKQALENKEDDFLTKNIVRYLLNEFFKDNYYTDKTDILNWILNYILHNDELKNLDLEFSWYFNWKEIISWKIDDKNMFESLNKNYLLSDLTSNFSNNIVWFKTNGNNKLYYDIWVWYYLRSKEIESKDLWIQINRNYYDYEDFNNSYTKKCESYSWFNYCFEEKLKNPEIINKTKKWNKVVWEITIILDKPRQNLVINDFIPSWFEIINSNFNTTSIIDKNITKNNGYWYNLAEYRYDWVYLYSQNLRPWTYTFRYVMQNINSWVFNLRPAFSQLIDDKQIWWRTRWWEFIVE